MLLAVIDQFDNVIRDWGSHFNWPAEQAIRLLVAAAAGGLVGLEREVRGRQAGFRTNILVAVGSALVMIISISFASRPWPHDPSFTLNIDPGRIAYGIMTGIGFLGAGTILKHGASIRGLTTAAGLWCVAAVGMAAGFGMYTLAFFATLLLVAALWILDVFEEFLPKSRYRTIVIRREWGTGCVVETVRRVQELGLKVKFATFQRSDDLRTVDVSLIVSFRSRSKYLELERKLVDYDKFHLMATKDA